MGITGSAARFAIVWSLELRGIRGFRVRASVDGSGLGTGGLLDVMLTVRFIDTIVLGGAWICRRRVGSLCFRRSNIPGDGTCRFTSKPALVRLWYGVIRVAVEVKDEDALECIANGEEVLEGHCCFSDSEDTKDPGDSQQRKEGHAQSSTGLDAFDDFSHSNQFAC